MSEPALPLPEPCRTALAALEQDPLALAPEILAHLRICAACAETRVLWLAQEEAPLALAPSGYFERLPGRVAAKLPAQKSAPRLLRPWLWAAAAVLLMAGVAGGFLAGRAHRPPVVEASLPHATPDLHEDLPDSPFQEKDDVLAKADQLTPEQLQALMKTLNEHPQ